MKKLLKLSLIVSLLMAVLTIRSYADETTDSTSIPQTDNDTAAATESTGTYTASYEEDQLVITGLSDGDYKFYVDTNSTSDDASTVSKLRLTKDGANYVHKDQLDELALASDIYAHVYKVGTPDEKIADIKITKPAFNKENYFANTTDAADGHCQFIFKLPFGLKSTSSTMNVTYKIGKITDKSILLSIKNEDATGLSKLKEFAKNDSSPVYNEKLASTQNSGYVGNLSLSGQQLSDEAYYYLYAELDTENGKYIPLSSVSFAKADVFPNLDYSWYLFFYGDNQFNWGGLDENQPAPSEESAPESNTVDDTVANTDLAKTGEKAIIFALIGVAFVASVVFFRKNKNTIIK